MNTNINEYHPDVVFHPGETLKEALEEHGMTNKEFSIRTGKPEKTISEIVNGKSSITAEMAIIFESVLYIPANFWLNKQMHYDEYMARLDRQKRIDEAKEWARQFPYPEMVKLGWVPATRRLEEKVIALFGYFGISRHEGWQGIYIKSKLKLNYRMSIKGSKNPHGLSAWLVQGEKRTQGEHVATFSKSKLKKTLPVLKTLMADDTGDVRERIETIMRNCGVIFKFTPCLKGVPVNGVSRWINNRPVLQLTDRWKRYDIFWFTLFHEIGHLMLHDKKFMSIENIDYDEKDLIKEREADDFAEEWTFSRKEEEKLIENADYSKEYIMEFAHEINTHPSIIVGRLAKRGMITYAQAWQCGLMKQLVFEEEISI